jgi:hypothetical protein
VTTSRHLIPPLGSEVRGRATEWVTSSALLARSVTGPTPAASSSIPTLARPSSLVRVGNHNVQPLRADRAQSLAGPSGVVVTASRADALARRRTNSRMARLVQRSAALVGEPPVRDSGTRWRSSAVRWRARLGEWSVRRMSSVDQPPVRLPTPYFLHFVHFVAWVALIGLPGHVDQTKTDAIRSVVGVGPWGPLQRDVNRDAKGPPPLSASKRDPW